MPGRDCTGPMGAGSMTGRGLGLCRDSNMVMPRNGFGIRLGLGCRRSFGRGYGRNYTFNRAHIRTEKELLQDQKSMLQDQIEAIDKQLENL